MTQFTIRGHDLLAVERFRDDTRHMIEFEVLKDDNLIALRGETARLFLNERGYRNEQPPPEGHGPEFESQGAAVHDALPAGRVELHHTGPCGHL